MSEDKKEVILIKEDEPMLMYLGPTIFNPVPLTHRSVFNGSPKMLEKLKKSEQDAFEAVLLPLPEAGQALVELEAGQGSAVDRYNKIKKMFGGRS